MLKQIPDNRTAVDICSWLAYNVGPVGEITQDFIYGQGWLVRSEPFSFPCWWRIEFDNESDKVMFMLRWS